MIVDPNKTIIVEPKVNLDENKIRAEKLRKVIEELDDLEKWIFDNINQFRTKLAEMKARE